jgi:hypothetical protein
MDQSKVVRQFVGVYDADGTVLGEIRYWVGARFGRSHCALCEITHGTFRERSEWQRFRESLATEFVTFHRDDAPVDVLEVCEGRLAAVAARTDDSVLVLLDNDALEGIGRDIDGFRLAIVRRCSELGLVMVEGSDGDQPLTSP